MDLYIFCGAVVGSALLFFGRRLFGVLVVGLGIVWGVSLTHAYGLDAGEGLVWVIALTSGLAVVLLARLLPRAAVWAVGFGAGAYAVAQLMMVMNFQPAPGDGPLQLAGACLGCLGFGLRYQWGLMLSSAIIGAGLLVNAFSLGVPARPLLFITLLVLGILFQQRLPDRTKTSMEEDLL